MPRYTKALTILALVGVTVAMIAAFASRPTSPSATGVRTVHPTATRPRPAPTPRSDAAVTIAVAYAAAARNWTAATYLRSWRSQVTLCAGRYRQALLAARPGGAELHALSRDHARSQARVLAVQRDPAASASRARVLVALQESTSANAHRLVGQTVNEVWLRRRRSRRWRVIGWTIVPDISMAQLRIR